MILTKYFQPKYGYDVLKNLRLKVSDPLEFNDPFELLPYIEGKITFQDFKKKLKDPYYVDLIYRRTGKQLGIQKRDFKTFIRSQNTYKEYLAFKEDIIQRLNHKLQELKESFSTTSKILCFSRLDLLKPTEEILMWAHYSKAHRGIRISFDTEKIKLKSMGAKEVKYQEERIKLDAKKIFWEDPDEFELMGSVLTKKSSAWEYEHEYRWFISNLECFSDGKYDFIKINSDAIVRVDIGVNSTTAFRNKLKKLMRSKEYLHVDLFLAELDEKDFELNYKKNETFTPATGVQGDGKGV